MWGPLLGNKINLQWRCSSRVKWNREQRIFPHETSMVPVVLPTMEGTLRMFFSDRIGRKSVPKSVLLDPEDYSQIEEIKGPILQLGDPGMFDWAGIMPTEVISQLTPKPSAIRAILSISVIPPRHGTLARTMSTACWAISCEVE